MVQSNAITHLYFLTDIVHFHDLIRENVVSETLSDTEIFHVSKKFPYQSTEFVYQVFILNSSYYTDLLIMIHS